MELTEARRLALELVPAARSEQVWLDQALGRVLAVTLHAHRDLPGEARALVDGFAVTSVAFTNSGTQASYSLKVGDKLLTAGDSTKYHLNADECLRITTGAPLPQNSDAVVPIEQIRQEGDRILVQRGFLPGEGVKSRGSDIHTGELLLTKGSVLSPTRLALLAALGYAAVPVFLQPTVALLSTGNELREIGQCFEGPYEYCNNRHLLAWSASLKGARIIHLGIAADDPEEIAGKLSNMEVDILISTGGVGPGDRDLTLAAWAMLGVEILFREINLSPGRRTALGVRGKQILLALPGSPWGAQVAYEQLAAPLLLQYQGINSPANISIPALLGSNVRKRKGFYQAIRGKLQQQISGRYIFVPDNKENRSLFMALHDNLAFILIGPQESQAAAGSEVQVYFHDFPLLAYPFFGSEGAHEGSYA
jgi:molybdopterin molybdotransferase